VEISILFADSFSFNTMPFSLYYLWYYFIIVVQTFYYVGFPTKLVSVSRGLYCVEA
jgi:hypothetical protein